MVTVTLSHTPPLYTGINLTLTCTVTLDRNVSKCEKIMMEWSGHQDIPEERYSILHAIYTYTDSGPHINYTGSLTISPLAYQDTGTYTCTGTIIGIMSFHQATSNIRINVNSKLCSHKTHILLTHCCI